RVLPGTAGLVSVPPVKVPSGYKAVIPLRLISGSWIEHLDGRPEILCLSLDGRLVWWGTGTWRIETG
ncbi:MAG TPA: hypothetical protein VI756_24060, partial [Blastocatellia bacterium]